jgi:hypothetical protein
LGCGIPTATSSPSRSLERQAPRTARSYAFPKSDRRHATMRRRRGRRRARTFANVI